MKKLLLIFIIFSICFSIIAKPDFVYRKEYKKYTQNDLIEKAIKLTQHTNFLAEKIEQKNNDIETLQRKLDKPFRNVFIGVIITLIGIGCIISVIIFLKVFFFFFKK
jgi:peptidoglycan hydrolase CwlO-like protein